MDEKVKICYDNEFKIRVLEPSKFEKAEELQKESSNFIDKISSFNEKVNSLVEILESHASRIDAQKLRAIGSRLAAENEAENRGKQQRALQTMIAERRAELDRYLTQFQSLERIEADQKAVLEKMSTAKN